MAEYLPIIDAEIAPEAPGTSILFHKLRDNPEAIAEGAAGAPRIQSAGIGAGQVTEVNINKATGIVDVGAGSTPFLIPGGNWSLGWHHHLPGPSFSPTASIATSQMVDSALDGPYYHAGGLDYTMTWHYIGPGSFELGFMYILKDKLSGDIVGRWFSENYPTYGAVRNLWNPFVSYNPADHFIYCIPIEPYLHKKIQFSQIPIIGGGYLTKTLFDADTYDVDYSRYDRNYFESMDALYTINYAIPTAWPTEPILISGANPVLNQTKPVKAHITKHPDLNCIGVSLI